MSESWLMTSSKETFAILNNRTETVERQSLGVSKSWDSEVSVL